MIELILGGARSGKSAFAERRALESGFPVTFIATAVAQDNEMAARIAAHRARRPKEWGLVEEPLALAAALRQAAGPEKCIIVDCLTLWLTNLLDNPDPANETLFQRERAAFMETLPGLPGHIVLVSNEVGMGIVPMGELSRRFQDEAGWLHQDLGRVCDRVTLMMAGMPLTVKGTGG